MTVLDLDVRIAHGAFRLAVAQRFRLAGVTALFGASGAGKSTLLRILAGFEAAAQGRVAFADTVWQDDAAGLFVAPHRRGVGLVFQDARLFPHLSVAGNLRYADRRAPRGGNGNGPRHGPEHDMRFDDVVGALDLAPLLARDVGALSGGERQRVAIGRTLLSRPRLLLMDEPLAALDVRRKAEILPYIERMARQFAVPVLYVTHSVEEAARLSERMILLADGAVVAEGPAAAILERLDLQPHTGRFEAGVLLAARVRDHDRAFHLTRLDVAGQDVLMPMVELAPGSTVQLRVRARDVALATERPEGISIRNVLAGIVTEIAEEPETAYAEVLVALDGPGAAGTAGGTEAPHLRARITRQAVAALGLAPGRPVHALVKSVSFDRRILPPD